MAIFKYIGPAPTARFKATSFSIGDTIEVDEALLAHFRNHLGFEEVGAVKKSKEPVKEPVKKSKKSKEPAELPEAVKESPSKE